MEALPGELGPVEFLQLLAEPVRWRLMEELVRSDLRVSELTAASGKPQNLVSYHLGLLRTAGLVSARRSSADGRDTYYRAELGRCREMLSATGAALHPGLRLVPTGSASRTPGSRAPRVLFVCTGNSARSQIAEALTRAMSDGAVDARSAGSRPKALHPNAVRVLGNRGIDISHHTTKHLRRFNRTHFDRVVTLCDRVREACPDFAGTPRLAHWSIADPALDGETDDDTFPAFERTAGDIEERVAFLLNDLLEEPPRTSKEGSHA